MNTKIRFIAVGGFLGAGKTTSIARLARHYMNQDKRVGIVTNDQSEDLVDTQSLQAQGFVVGEVHGACFCCSFNHLIATLNDLEATQVPDVILAEPVGSCTDLIATVMEPLRHLYGDRYEMGPLAVLLKPEHGRKILRQELKAGFSPKAAYIFLKQIEEADVVAINKVDKLSEPEINELVQLVQQQFPEKIVLSVSAQTGEGFDDLITAVSQAGPAERKWMEVDYDIYAEGESELGWLNCQLMIRSAGAPFSLDQLVQQIVTGLAEMLEEIQAETAHIKVLAKHEQSVSVANLVAAASEVELSMESQALVPEAEVILNARVATDPEQLESIARKTIQTVATAEDLQFEIQSLRCFRPGRPRPTHRYSVGTGD